MSSCLLWRMLCAASFEWVSPGKTAIVLGNGSVKNASSWERLCPASSKTKTRVPAFATGVAVFAWLVGSLAAVAALVWLVGSLVAVAALAWLVGSLVAVAALVWLVGSLAAVAALVWLVGSLAAVVALVWLEDSLAAVAVFAWLVGSLAAVVALVWLDGSLAAIAVLAWLAGSLAAVAALAWLVGSLAAGVFSVCIFSCMPCVSKDCFFVSDGIIINEKMSKTQQVKKRAKPTKSERFISACRVIVFFVLLLRVFVLARELVFFFVAKRGFVVLAPAVFFFVSKVSVFVRVLVVFFSGVFIPCHSSYFKAFFNPSIQCDKEQNISFGTCCIGVRTMRTS